jgi:hypothetical protein
MEQTVSTLRKWFKFNLPTSIIAQIVLSLFPKTSNQSRGLSRWLSAFIYLRPGPKPCQAVTRARPGSAYEGSAGLGPRLEAGPCTSLTLTAQVAFTQAHLDQNVDREKLENKFRASMNYAKVIIPLLSFILSSCLKPFPVVLCAHST